MIKLNDDPKLYKRMHQRILRARGSASKQLCVRHAELGIEIPAKHWAQIHTESGLDIWSDYMPLCQSCHFRYDGFKGRPAGWHHTPESRAKMSQQRLGVPKSPEHAARIGAAQAGRVQSDVTRAKISAKAKITQADRLRDALGRYAGPAVQIGGSDGD